MLFLLTPVVKPVAVGSLRVSTVALSAVVLALGLSLGTGVFARRGRQLFALAHGVFAVAWALLVAGAGFLVSQQR